MKTPSIMAVIPARGGSKTIPGKNITLVATKPLIAWTIESALQSQQLKRTIVSTDDVEIAEVAEKWGAEVPFMRPVELAQDDTPGIAPIIHSVEWLAQYEGYQPDYVMCLQPTSPLRTVEDIDAAVQLMLHRDAPALVSVTLVEQHPYWTKKITQAGHLTDFLTLNHVYTRRQDLPEVYALNGAIYMAHRDMLLEQRTWYTDKTCAYIMPRERSLDIDTMWDLYLATLILTDREKND